MNNLIAGAVVSNFTFKMREQKHRAKAAKRDDLARAEQA